MEVADYLAHHNVRGGLEVLDCLGLKISDTERVAFIANWDDAYSSTEEHFLSATAELYSQLPRLATGVALEHIDKAIEAQRVADFFKRLNSRRLKFWMTE